MLLKVSNFEYLEKSFETFLNASIMNIHSAEFSRYYSGDFQFSGDKTKCVNQLIG